MPRKQFLKDYGTAGGVPYRAERTKENTRSFRCIDPECNALQFYTLKETIRRKVLTCLRCGNSIQETKPSYDRHVRQVGNKEKRRRDVEYRSNEEPQQCLCCDSKWDGMASLAFHITGNNSCFVAYATVDNCLFLDGVPIVRDTLYVMEIDDHEFDVMGIDAQQKRVVKVHSCKSMRKAQEFIAMLDDENS